MNESIFEKVKEVARIEEVVEHFGVHLDRRGAYAHFIREDAIVSVKRG